MLVGTITGSGTGSGGSGGNGTGSGATGIVIAADAGDDDAGGDTNAPTPGIVGSEPLGWVLVGTITGTGTGTGSVSGGSGSGGSAGGRAARTSERGAGNGGDGTTGTGLDGAVEAGDGVETGGGVEAVGGTDAPTSGSVGSESLGGVLVGTTTGTGSGGSGGTGTGSGGTGIVIAADAGDANELTPFATAAAVSARSNSLPTKRAPP